MDMLFWGPESNGYAFLGPGVQWICFFGARSPMDMLFWGPEFNGYSFLGPGVQWICFSGIPENQGICHWMCFFGARSPMDMLFWDTRKPRDLPLDMLFWGPESNGYANFGAPSPIVFWGPESNGYAFLGPGVRWICFFRARSPVDMLFWGPEFNGYSFSGRGVQWICFFGIPENQVSGYTVSSWLGFGICFVLVAQFVRSLLIWLQALCSI